MTFKLLVKDGEVMDKFGLMMEPQQNILKLKGDNNEFKNKRL